MNVDYVPFREVASFLSGGTPSKTRDDFWQGSIPWVSPKDMGGSRVVDAEDHISDAAVAASATKLVEPGTILVVARSGILVRKFPVAIVEAQVAFNQDIKAIVVDRNVLLPEFAFWWLRASEAEVLARGVKKGATVHSLLSSFLEDRRIPLPPLDEQRRIVDILNRAASIERLRAEARDKLRAFIPALFIKMFGDPIENPMGWQVEPLGGVIGGFLGGKNILAGDGSSNYRILKVSAVTSGRFEPSENKAAPDRYLPPDEHRVRKGDLLFSRANTSALVGATAIVEEDVDGLLLPDKLWRLIWKKPTKVIPAFMLALFQHTSTREAMSRMATGTSDSMKNISQAKLKLLPTIVPPLELQHRFADVAAAARGIAASADTAKATASSLTASLMDRLFAEAD